MQRTYLSRLRPLLAALCLPVLLTACGGGSTSSTTIPSYESVSYVFNLVFRNSTTLSTGYNAFGQLGTGNLNSTNIAGPLNRYYNFKGFAAGGNFSVAFDSNGKTWAWGYNAYGQLGNNTTNYSSIPVLNCMSTSVVKSLAAGSHHVLALKADNSLWTWGRNNYGQLGLPISVSQSNVPVRFFPDFHNFSSFAAYGYNSAVRADGKVYVWGYNSNGQVAMDPKLIPYLPYSSAATKALRVSVVQGLPVTGIDQIAAGGASIYALGRDGSVWAWGNNYNGQLGNNSNTDSFTPVNVVDAKGNPLTGIVKIAAGIQHCLALRNDGSVWAWGYNFYGQLGNNLPNDSWYAMQVLDTTGLNYLPAASDIRAFGSSSMARVGNSWYVWGNNLYGQLGTGSYSTVLLPVKMVGF